MQNDFSLLSPVTEYGGNIPMHTADCERAFFQMNVIKKDIKNCLTENLSKLSNKI